MKIFKLILLLVFLVGCKKYERVNPLDPLYLIDKKQSEIIVVSYSLSYKTFDINKKYYDLYLTIKNIGYETRQITVNINESDSKIDLPFYSSKEFGIFGSTDDIINNNQTKTQRTPFTVSYPVTDTLPYSTNIQVILEDISNKTWTESLQITVQ